MKWLTVCGCSCRYVQVLQYMSWCVTCVGAPEVGHMMGNLFNSVQVDFAWYSTGHYTNTEASGMSATSKA